MDLNEALALAASPLLLPIQSSIDLADAVNASHETHPGGLHPVLALDGPRPIRVADLLQRLTQATSYRMQDDLYRVYSHWALLRYLGVFRNHHGYLRLSREGEDVVGNQRRILSEELGIGASGLVAELWHRRFGTPSTVRLVDVDVALSRGAVSKFGLRKTVRQIGAYRPDYIAVTDDASLPGSYRISLVESKGTRAPGYSVRQMIKASHQVRGLAVGGRIPPGIAVSSILTHGRCETRVLSTIADRTGVAGAVSDDVGVEVGRQNLEFEAGRAVDLSTPSQQDPRVLAAAALEASWALMAQYSGNEAAARYWSPQAMLEKRERRFVEPDRGLFDDPTTERTVVGVAAQVPLPGGLLEVVRGVDAELDAALSSTDPDRVIDTQARIREFGAVVQPANEPTSLVTARSSEGAVLMLRAL